MWRVILGEGTFVGAWAAAGVVLAQIAQLDDAYDNLMSEKNILGTFVAMLIMGCVYLYFAHGRQWFDDRHKERLAGVERHNKMADTLTAENAALRATNERMVEQGERNAVSVEQMSLAVHSIAASIRANRVKVLLVIEDVRADWVKIRGLFDKLPNRDDFAITWAQSLSRAKKQWDVADVVLADLNLQDADWAQTLDYMRLIWDDDKPIIFYTAEENATALQKAAELGVVVHKTADPKTLIEAVSKALDAKIKFGAKGR